MTLKMIGCSSSDLGLQCGTPEYLAPEIIVNKGYGHAVDWWAVGILTYEMRCGRSPFESRSQMDMFKKITKRDYKFPRFHAAPFQLCVSRVGRDFTEDERSFIDGLLQVDLTRRLGNMHGGVEDIKRHAYFRKLDWDKMYSMEAPSPYVPKVRPRASCYTICVV